MRNHNGFVLAAILLAACAETRAEQTSEPLPTQPLPTGVPTLAATLAIEEPPVPSPTGVPITPLSIEPNFTGQYFQVLDWSPDSQWALFVMSENSDSIVIPHFYNVSTGEHCTHPELVVWDNPDFPLQYRVASQWQDDGTVILKLGGFFKGTPCAGDFAQTDQAFTPGFDQMEAVSLKGTYRMVTSEVPNDESGVDITHTFTDAATGAVITTVSYMGSGGLGGPVIGGMWVSNTEFLVTSTPDRGPLLMDVENGSISELLPDVFHVDLTDKTYQGFFAEGIVGDTGYHLLLGNSYPDRLPSELLYHPESGEVEAVGESGTMHSGLYTSPDGIWLLLTYNPETSSGNGTPQYEAFGLMARPVDPVGSEAQYIAAGSVPLFDPAWMRVAMTLGRDSVEPPHVSLYSFPGGDLLGVWQTGRYRAVPQIWSPDGRYLILSGFIPETLDGGLFIVEP
jgi:WD40 repeat protein